MELLEMGDQMHAAIYLQTPYRTGNLANNGKSDLYNPLGINSIGFDIGGKGTEYAKILNEVLVISRIYTTKSGKTAVHNYANVHYNWIGRFVSSYAAILAAQLGGELSE